MIRLLLAAFCLLTQASIAKAEFVCDQAALARIAKADLVERKTIAIEIGEAIREQIHNIDRLTTELSQIARDPVAPEDVESLKSLMKEKFKEAADYQARTRTLSVCSDAVIKAGL